MRAFTVAAVPYPTLQHRIEQSGSLAFTTGFILSGVRMPVRFGVPSIDCNPLP